MLYCAHCSDYSYLSFLPQNIGHSGRNPVHRSLTQVTVDYKKTYISKVKANKFSFWRVKQSGVIPTKGLIIYVRDTSICAMVVSEITPIKTNEGFVLAKNIKNHVIYNCEADRFVPITKIEPYTYTCKYAKIYVPGYHSLVLNKAFIIGDDKISQQLLKKESAIKTELEKFAKYKSLIEKTKKSKTTFDLQTYYSTEYDSTFDVL